MHTVAETKAFRRQAAAAGMSEDDIQFLVDYLSTNPMAGDEMPGTGGCRKVRVAGRSKGKRGGYRTITFYSGLNMPVFLLAAFSKGEKADLSQKEQSALAGLTKAIIEEYASKVVPVRKVRG